MGGMLNNGLFLIQKWLKGSTYSYYCKVNSSTNCFNEVGRQSIIADPNWNEGNYYGTKKAPENGLSVARMVAHITYLSDESMYLKFGRDLQDKEEVSYDLSLDFQVESYLHHQGESFC